MEMKNEMLVKIILLNESHDESTVESKISVHNKNIWCGRFKKQHVISWDDD